MPVIVVWILTLCSVGFFMLCDSLITHWAKTSSLSSLATVIVLSPVAYLFFGFVTSRANLAVGGAMVNLMLVIGAVLVGFFYFKENITAWQWTGISLGMVAIVILGTSTHK